MNYSALNNKNDIPRTHVCKMLCRWRWTIEETLNQFLTQEKCKMYHGNKDIYALLSFFVFKKHRKQLPEINIRGNIKI